MENSKKRCILSLITCVATLLVVAIIAILSSRLEAINIIARMIVGIAAGLQVGEWSARIYEWLVKKLNLLED